MFDYDSKCAIKSENGSFWEGYCRKVLFHDIRDLDGTKSLFFNIELYGRTCITSAIVSVKLKQISSTIWESVYENKI